MLVASRRRSAFELAASSVQPPRRTCGQLHTLLQIELWFSLNDLADVRASRRAVEAACSEQEEAGGKNGGNGGNGGNKAVTRLGRLLGSTVRAWLRQWEARRQLRSLKGHSLVASRRSQRH